MCVAVDPISVRADPISCSVDPISVPFFPTDPISTPFSIYIIKLKQGTDKKSDPRLEGPPALRFYGGRGCVVELPPRVAACLGHPASPRMHGHHEI